MMKKLKNLKIQNQKFLVYIENDQYFLFLKTNKLFNFFFNNSNSIMIDLLNSSFISVDNSLQQDSIYS